MIPLTTTLEPVIPLTTTLEPVIPLTTSVGWTVLEEFFELPALPVEQPVILFTLALATFLVAPLLFDRIGIPGIVGIVLFGTAIGPHGIGLLGDSATLELLGTVGLVYLLFTVGLELDLRGFAKSPEDAAIFGLTSFFLPFGLGTAAGHFLLGLDPWAAALLAAVFSSHTLIAYPVINSLDISKRPSITAVFGGILFTDTLALVVLAIALGAVEGGLTVFLFAEVLLKLVLLFGGIYVVVPPVARWFFQNLSQESYYEFLFVVVVLFGAASAAELLDIAAILGSFLAGIALNRQITRGGTLMNRIEFVGNAFFIPFFLFYVGTLVNPGVLFDGVETLVFAVTVIGIMFLTKFAAAAIVSAAKGYTSAERGVLFGLSIGQAAAALAITLIGFDIGIFDETILNAVVLMMLVSAIASPWLTERYGRQVAQSGDVEPGDGEASDPRILLPLSTDAEKQQRLLELAFALKDDLAEEPVHLLTVVRPTRGTVDEETVAEVESDLERAAEFGGAAEVPVRSETRINHNVASGIVRGSEETRADLIVMGWDANRSFSRRIFGSIIDQVLKRTTVPVMISRLGHPINTTKTIHVVIPRGIDHHDGFYETVYLTKLLADRLGAGLECIVVGGSDRQYETLFEFVEPELEASFESIDGWGSVLETLERRTDDDDLVIALSPRQGRVGWEPELAELPGRLHELPPRSFIVIYAREGDPEYAAQYLKFD